MYYVKLFKDSQEKTEDLEKFSRCSGNWQAIDRALKEVERYNADRGMVYKGEKFISHVGNPKRIEKTYYIGIGTCDAECGWIYYSDRGVEVDEVGKIKLTDELSRGGESRTYEKDGVIEISERDYLCIKERYMIVHCKTKENHSEVKNELPQLVKDYNWFKWRTAFLKQAALILGRK